MSAKIKCMGCFGCFQFFHYSSYVIIGAVDFYGGSLLTNMRGRTSLNRVIYFLSRGRFCVPIERSALILIIRFTLPGYMTSTVAGIFIVVFVGHFPFTFACSCIPCQS